MEKPAADHVRPTASAAPSGPFQYGAIQVSRRSARSGPYGWLRQWPRNDPPHLVHARDIAAEVVGDV
jgi:hypothetical protein